MSYIPELSEGDAGIDEADWPVIAKAEAHSMVDGGRYVMGQLHVRSNAKGTIMAHSSINDDGKITPLGGITKTPDDDEDLRLILISAVQQLRCGPILVDSVMQQLRQTK